jgi:hypothetical protein
MGWAFYLNKDFTKLIPMENIFKRKRKKMKEEPNRFSGKMESNKFAGKRKYQIRLGLPEKTLVRLKDLHEMLQCDPDDQGYVVTTFKEIQELTEMDLVILSIMTGNRMILKRVTGGSPKFKYKWDTIEPTIDMAVKLLEKRIDNNQSKDAPDGIISESQPESIIPEPEKKEDDYEPGLRVPELSGEFDPSIIVDSKVAGDVMTMHVNLKKLGITETDVLNAVLAISSNK